MTTTSNSTGLRYWMLRVLEECDNVSRDFSSDPVHDLRVSLRRCRSVADGMMAMDPGHDWKAMKKAGKQLFQQLGALRDVQIMMEWIDKLEGKSAEVKKETQLNSREDPRDGRSETASSTISVGANDQPKSLIDPARHAFLQILKARESEHKEEARAALEEFDRKQWRQWSKSLPQSASRFRRGSAVFKHLALERWTAARELHVRAMRVRSQVALHTLRIGIKRFRYIVENFLPQEHKLWSGDLKHLQDLLGEVHDLDVLWATGVTCRIFPDASSRNAWHTRIVEERTERVNEYRAQTSGTESLWKVWRAGLPQGKRVAEIATRRMKLWASVLDPDFAHSERVSGLAMELYNGLRASGLLSGTLPGSSPEEQSAAEEHMRMTLYAAALLHDVGKAKDKKGHHKHSLDLIKKHGTPLGWKDHDMALAAIVARFHCGALPTRHHKALRDLLPGDQKQVIRLSAILRLANALDRDHDGQVHRLKVVNLDSSKSHNDGFLHKPAILGKNEAVIIEAEGYRDGTATAQAVAAERYLLETVLRHPVLVKPASGFRRQSPGIRREHPR